jgi:hypothetical protein
MFIVEFVADAGAAAAMVPAIASASALSQVKTEFFKRIAGSRPRSSSFSQHYRENRT